MCGDEWVALGDAVARVLADMERERREEKAGAGKRAEARLDLPRSAAGEGIPGLGAGGGRNPRELNSVDAGPTRRRGATDGPGLRIRRGGLG
jgi:hypothetical protein